MHTAMLLGAAGPCIDSRATVISVFMALSSQSSTLRPASPPTAASPAGGAASSARLTLLATLNEFQASEKRCASTPCETAQSAMAFSLTSFSPF